jgi:hypothetical protein
VPPGELTYHHQIRHYATWQADVLPGDLTYHPQIRRCATWQADLLPANRTMRELARWQADAPHSRSAYVPPQLLKSALKIRLAPPTIPPGTPDVLPGTSVTDGGTAIRLCSTRQAGSIKGVLGSAGGGGRRTAKSREEATRRAFRARERRCTGHMAPLPHRKNVGRQVAARHGCVQPLLWRMRNL